MYVRGYLQGSENGRVVTIEGMGSGFWIFKIFPFKFESEF
jgi:hypothetical protein